MIELLNGFKPNFPNRHTVVKVSIRLSIIAGLLLSIFIWPTIKANSMEDNAQAASHAESDSDECFEQVNEGGFGLLSGSFKSEESYSVSWWA